MSVSLLFKGFEPSLNIEKQEMKQLYPIARFWGDVSQQLRLLFALFSPFSNLTLAQRSFGYKQTAILYDFEGITSRIRGVDNVGDAHNMNVNPLFSK